MLIKKTVDYIIFGAAKEEGKQERAVIDLQYGDYAEIFALLAAQMEETGEKPTVYVDKHDGILDVAVVFAFTSKNPALLAGFLGSDAYQYSQAITANGLEYRFIAEAEIPDTGNSPFFPPFEANGKFEVWIREDDWSDILFLTEVTEYKDTLPYRAQQKSATA